MGKAAFVSHQWVTKAHPDPELKQLQVLQGALRHLLCGTGFVPLDPITEAIVPTAKSLSLREFQSSPLFLWYDYFSCPQRREGSSLVDLEKAIDSIPAYIAQCDFFFGLCPVIDCPSEARVLTTKSWSERGWCRIERLLRELSDNDKWVLIKSNASLELVGSAVGFLGGSAGEGQFSRAEDRAKLAPVLKRAVLRKLSLCLNAKDFAAYRRHLNMQAVHLRGLDIEVVPDLIPGFEGELGSRDIVSKFLYQNGFSTVRDVDSAGWSPLHYAALSGSSELIEGLLRQRADPNRRTSKDQPQLGCPPWTSALDLAVFFRNDSARLLVAARARLEGGVQPAMSYAAMADNASGVRLLCDAKGSPLAQGILGVSVLETAAAYGAASALEAIVQRAPENALDFSSALFSTMFTRGGTAEMVDRLLELRADVNWQLLDPTEYKVSGRSLLGIVVAMKSLQHRFGRATPLSTLFYNLPGMTPLMAAVLTAQYAGAAALLAAGARLNLKNRRNRTAEDFARGRSLPYFLIRGLQRDPSECQGVFSRELAQTYVEV